jgi:flagellar biosynthesis anti-sigma factor FlgM
MTAGSDLPMARQCTTTGNGIKAGEAVMEIKNSMLSKLDPYSNKLDPKTEAASAAKAYGSGADAQSARAPAGDKVTLSAAARLHTTAHAAASNAPDVRQEKVNSIKERVDSGSYTVDSKKVAQKLLENEADFASALKE